MKTIKPKFDYEYEYPLLSPNCILYRKGGNNPIPLYALWDGGGCLEIYRTADDTLSSLISLDILYDDFTYWYDCLRKVPDVTDYKLVITRPIKDCLEDKVLFTVGESFSGFDLVYSPGKEEEEDCE